MYWSNAKWGFYHKSKKSFDEWNLIQSNTCLDNSFVKIFYCLSDKLVVKSWANFTSSYITYGHYVELTEGFFQTIKIME